MFFDTNDIMVGLGSSPYPKVKTFCSYTESFLPDRPIALSCAIVPVLLVDNYTPMSGKTITWIVVIIIVLAGGYYWWSQSSAPVETGTTPTTETPTTETVPAQ